MAYNAVDRERARETMRRLFKHRSKRTLADERIYHGACLEDEFLEGTAPRHAPPVMSATRPGPIPGHHFQGAWGTTGPRKCSTDVPPGADPPPVRVVGFGVASQDGRKRAARGGASEDAFACIVDLLAVIGPEAGGDAGAEAETGGDSEGAPAADRRGGGNSGGGGGSGGAGAADDAAPGRSTAGAAATASGGGSGSGKTTFIVGSDRVFHLFGAFDGHRSNHAARYCAEVLGTFVARRLRGSGVLQPLPTAGARAATAATATATSAAAAGDTAAAADAAAEMAEEAAVRAAFSHAVSAVDDTFCARRWVSLVRDNGKKFYLTRSREVEPAFDIDAWDAYPLEVQFRDALSRKAEAHGRAAGVPDGVPLQQYVAAHQERWRCYKKELCPGAALCAVLVDEARGKVYCANVGDSGAMLYHATTAAAAAVPAAAPAAAATTTATAADGVPPPGVAHCGGSGGEDPLQVWGDFKAWTAPPDEHHDVRAGGLKLLCRAHKPSQPVELQRVCNTAEGFVLVHGIHVTMENHEEVARHVMEAQARGQKALYRINRDISLSRAIGDRDLKQFGVIGTPDVTVHRCEAASGNGGLLCVVVATDGVWDVISPGACARMLQQSVDDAQGQQEQEQQQQHGGGAAARSGGGGGGGGAATAPFAAVAQTAVERLVSAAKGVEKNNDDVTAVVVTLWQQP